ncbi:MAG: zinc ribbon domain-containing protein [Candidatus Methanoculleus thermohydrogenotrophicum]
MRVHECPRCGFVADRDYNAAVNIRRGGMEQSFDPVEMRPLHHISVMQVWLLSMIAGKPRTDERGVVHSFHTS